MSTLRERIQVSLSDLLDNAPLDHMGTGSIESGRISEAVWKARIKNLTELIKKIPKELQ